MSAVYVDTSALLKRYLPERGSEAFDAWFAARAPALISRLTLVEMRAALARKRREGRPDAHPEQAAVKEIRIDVQDGILSVHPLSDADLLAAYHLIESFPQLALRPLDAMHLAAA